MKRWYASVNFGLELAASKIIKSYGAKDIQVLDSALIFSCAHPIDVKCINNLFMILVSYASDNISGAAKQLLTSARRVKYPRLEGRTFRVIIMDCGKLRAISTSTMKEIEKTISRNTKLSVNRANPDIEIWLNRRNNNAVYFMVRVKKHPSFDKNLKKGELRPDIVDIMIHMAKTNKGMVIADPFGGWGAIAAAVTESGRYKKMHTGDIEEECVRYQKNRLQGKRDCIVTKWDALKLPLEDKSVDAIITDPPWGEYQDLDIEPLYEGFIREAVRVLADKGVLVFLSSALEIASIVLKKHNFRFSYTPLKLSGKDTFLLYAKMKENK